jgi:hypothetical protein
VEMAYRWSHAVKGMRCGTELPALDHCEEKSRIISPCTPECSPELQLT